MWIDGEKHNYMHRNWDDLSLKLLKKKVEIW